MMNQEDKIVISAGMAATLLTVLLQQQEVMQEKLLDLQIEIEDLENALKNPVPALEKKAGDFTLTAPRVVSAVSKHSGLSYPELANVLAIDLNLDNKDKELMKRLKGAVYAHLYALKKKGKVVTEYVQESAATVYFPASVEEVVS